MLWEQCSQRLFVQNRRAPLCLPPSRCYLLVPSVYFQKRTVFHAGFISLPANCIRVAPSVISGHHEGLSGAEVPGCELFNFAQAITLVLAVTSRTDNPFSPGYFLWAYLHWEGLLEVNLPYQLSGSKRMEAFVSQVCELNVIIDIQIEQGRKTCFFHYCTPLTFEIKYILFMLGILGLQCQQPCNKNSLVLTAGDFI